MKQSKNKKHINQVRIVGGTLGGRKLVFAAAEGLRPTPDMVREKLFNWLGQDLTGQTVLDLFAGSGALGFEAVSRRAKRVVMVDNHPPTIRSLSGYAREFEAVRAEVVLSEGLRYLQNSREVFDLVFLDPPFAWGEWGALFALLQPRLAQDAMVYVEVGCLPHFPQWLEKYREGRSGMSTYVLLKSVQAAE